MMHLDSNWFAWSSSGIGYIPASKIPAKWGFNMLSPRRELNIVSQKTGSWRKFQLKYGSSNAWIYASQTTDTEIVIEIVQDSVYERAKRNIELEERAHDLVLYFVNEKS